MAIELDADVLRLQCDSLRSALVKVLDTREAEARARASYENAMDNFSDRGAAEERRLLAAMTAASNAEREARLLLATLRTPHAGRGPTRAQRLTAAGYTRRPTLREFPSDE